MFIEKMWNSDARPLLVLAAAVMASAPMLSHADESGPSYQVKFSTPTTPEAARHVYAKIEMAAYYACGTSTSGIESIAGKPGPCVHEAIGRAIHNAKNANLAQVYIEKNGMDEASKFGISSDAMTAKR